MSSTLLLPPRAQLCNRSCSNKTHTQFPRSLSGFQKFERYESRTMTSAVGGSPLLDLVSGPRGRLRYHEHNTHKVTKSQSAVFRGLVSGILPVAEEQSRTRGSQSGGVEDQPQCRGLWHSSSPSARSLALPFSSPSFFHTVSPAFTSA